MYQTFEATIDQDGKVTLLEKIHIEAVHRALVTILEEIDEGDEIASGLVNK